MSKRVEISFESYSQDGLHIQSGPSAPCGFWTAVKELWLFWHSHGTHLNDYDTMTITFSPHKNKRFKEANGRSD